jgi:hypothetical protein
MRASRGPDEPSHLDAPEVKPRIPIISCQTAAATAAEPGIQAPLQTVAPHDYFQSEDSKAVKAASARQDATFSMYEVVAQ